MCGIVGFIGADNNQTENINSILCNGLYNVHRGDDGIGIMYSSAMPFPKVEYRRLLEG